jgi:protease IV
MRDFLKYTFASLVGLILFVMLGAGGLLFLVIAITNSAKNATPGLKDQTILAFDLSLNIPDTKPEQSLSGVVSGDSSSESIPLRRVLNAIDQAAKDDRIVGLYLYDSGPMGSTGFASLQEVRQALQTFRATGKPIYAYGLDGNEREYYLTSVADKILFNPSGVLEMNGFRAETMFYGGALQKYGIGMQIVRVGRYKSFVEQYTRSNSSPDARRETQELLNDLWNEFLTTAATSRKLKPQQLQTFANNEGYLQANQAKSAKLIDQVVYADQVAAQLRSLTGETKESDSDPFRQISLPDYAAIAAKDSKSSQNHIAVIYAEGSIVSGDGNAGEVGGDRLAKQLRDLRQDDSVKAIVLRVDSPGGSATASDLVAREVKLTDAVKPVIASMGNYAASGGYLISTNARKIFASPTTVTGSIGVFGLLPNVQKIANTNGITWDVVKTGPYADLQTIARPKTPEELKFQQSIVDTIYDRFINTVADSRSLSKARVNEVAQGRVWSGLQAQKVGLIDHLGGLQDAIQAAVQQADLGNDWQITEYPQTRSLPQQILTNLFGTETPKVAAPTDPLSIQLQNLKADLTDLRAMNDPVGTYMRLPMISRIN